jgi:hypothetical protein
MSSAVKDGLILAKLANELTLAPLLSEDDFNNLLPLHYDSDNAIKIVTNSKLSTKVAWISTRYYLVRDLIKRNLIALINISSKDNLPDILTKSKPFSVFEDNRDNLLYMRRPSSFHVKLRFIINSSLQN